MVKSMLQTTSAQDRKLKKLEDQLEEAYAVEDAGLQAYLIIGRVMAEIRNEKLYIGTHASFDDYCRDRWEESRKTVDKRIAAMTAATDVKDVQIEVQNDDAQCASLSSQAPKNARVAIELSKVNGEERRADAWTKAVRTAPKNVPTAAHVKKVIGEMLPAIDDDDDDGKADDEPVPEAWEILAATHKEALNLLTKITRMFNEMGKSEPHIQYIKTRIKTDIAQLRGSIGQSMPVDVKDGKMITKGQQESSKDVRAT